jgi:aspartate carbamoyltransferase catalytic subunit
MPTDVEKFGVACYHRLEDVLPWADVLMVLRLQRERHSKGYIGSLGEYAREYGLNMERLSQAKPDVVVMHPGPANLGIEISDEVSQDPRSVITTQVTNGVAVRMALLYLLSGGDADGVAY